jgi:hypothetical protein
MRAHQLLSLLLPVVLACSEDTPTPTDTKPTFATGCTEFPTVTAEPPTATQPPNKSGSVANFLVTNNCAVSATFKMTASKSGQVTFVSVPSPSQPIIGATKSQFVTITYNTGAVGTGQVTLTAALSTNLSISALASQVISVSQPVTAKPFGVGPWHPPANQVGATLKWSGAVRNGYVPSLRAMLDSLRGSKARVVLSVLRGPMKNPDGTLSIANFRTEMGRWAAAADIASYFSDGTIIAINVMDDNASAWVNPVTPAQVDSLAQIVKQNWPIAKVSTRTRPSQLEGYPFVYLDIAWSQYRSPEFDGSPTAYRDKEVADARNMHLGLVLGLNVLNGGCGPASQSQSKCLSGVLGSNILGTDQNAVANRRYQMSAAELKYYGSIFIAEPYNCALLAWQYSIDYPRQSWMSDSQYNGIVGFDKRSDVISSWQQLVAQGKNRSEGQCKRLP